MWKPLLVLAALANTFSMASASAPECKKENEKYSNCVNRLCAPRHCSDLGYPVQCPHINATQCIGGCVCKDGYVYNDHGDCIPKQNCSSCGADPNAISGCGNCRETCLDLTHTDPKFCTMICYDNACDCKGDYVLDTSTGKCIPPEDCVTCGGEPNAKPGCDKKCKNRCPGPKPAVCNCPKDSCECKEGFVYDPAVKRCVRPKNCKPPCKKNEVYSDYIDICLPLNCSQLGYPVPCPKSGYFKKGCTCIDDYVRADNGTCIPVAECPSCGGDPNAKSGCAFNCNKHCSNLVNGREVCPRIPCPQNGCECREDYYYDHNLKKCVLPKDCTPICKKNEVYSESINICEPQNCSQVGYPIACPASDDHYIKGCKCKDGYMRAENGACIPVAECPSCGGDPHAVSGCGVNCLKHCSDLNGPPKGCPKICHVNACDCRDGYYFDDQTKKCISPNQCSPICKANEVYSTCANGECSKRNCSQIDQPEICVLPQKCIGGCVCQKGWLRNKNGLCIPEEECPMKCQGPNEYFSCGGACDNVCATIHKQNKTNCPIQNIKCNPMCYCKDGYARDDQMICIPIKKCPVSCHGDPNAVPGCGNHCGRRCSDYNKGPIPCPLYCLQDGCDCKINYVYDDNLKKCVLPKDCTPICKANEVYSTCANGGCSKRNCSQIDQTEICVLPQKCIGGCVCQKGWLRNKNGLCIPEEECPRKCNKENEYYDLCPPICPPQTCESIGKAYSCPAMIVGEDNCNGTCRCNKGYYRNKIGECISEKDCLKCQGRNEYFSCGGACDNVCATIHKQNTTNCPIKNIKCNPMCYCEDGYARDDRKICIPIKKCSVSCHGDPNAVPGCGNHCGRRCSDYNKGPFFCPLYCLQDGCDCKNNYVYDDNLKKCVLPNDCTPVCNANEVYSSCANGGCRKRTCSDRGILCINPIKCKDGCICRDGYVRADNGTCIPENQCPEQCQKPHEIYDPCPSNCPAPNCENVDDVQTCPLLPESERNCEGACVCENGYYRNKLGECIAETDCRKCKGPKEYFSCGGACDNVCSTLSEQNQTHCPIVNIKCNPMCYCDKDFARNDEGICIPIEQCGVSCHGDLNAVPGCGNHCGRSCSDYDKGPIPCPLYCLQDGCDCKQNYVYDKNTETCVLPKDCSPACKENEGYDSCANGGCRRWTCSNTGILCIDPSKCKGGCLCKPGYLRADDGISCVPQDQCPIPNCGPNEVYDSCGNSGCKKRSCFELDSPTICRDPLDCVGDCVCVDGYVRNEYGLCIPENECPTCKGQNEVYLCTTPCDNVCATLEVRNRSSCPLGNLECKCYCKEEYARDENNVCVPIDDCPACENTTPPTSTVNVTEALARVNKASIALTGNFLYQLLSGQTTTNFVLSATSVLFPLAQLAYFSTGTVLEQLLALLNLQSKDEIKSVFPIIQAGYENQTEVEFEVANKYYANINFPLSENFKQFSVEEFKSTSQNIDFSKNVEAADTINNWVEEATHDKIQDLVSADMFNADTRIVLLNAMYFSGNWLDQFNPNDTETQDFYLDDTNIAQIPIMYQQGSFNYYEDDDLQIQTLEMPYKNSNFSFLVILPRAKGVEAVKTVANKLRDADRFTEILEKSSNKEVKVYLPYMKISTSLNLSEMLKNDNVTEMFDPRSDGFSGILEDPKPIYVSKVIQKGFISVDETGTEAAVATAIIGVTATAVEYPPPEILVFKATHPHLIYILAHKIPIFGGAFLGKP